MARVNGTGEEGYLHFSRTQAGVEVFVHYPPRLHTDSLDDGTAQATTASVRITATVHMSLTAQQPSCHQEAACAVIQEFEAVAKCLA